MNVAGVERDGPIKLVAELTSILNTLGAIYDHPRPRLLLLDAEPCEYPAIVITAYSVTDSAGQFVTGANSKSEATAIAQRYANQYRKPFFVGDTKIYEQGTSM